MVESGSGVIEGEPVMVTEYGGGWIGYTPAGPPLPRELRPKPVATWQATLPVTANGPSLVFDPALDRDELIAALNERPEHMPFAWPDTERRVEADLRTLALLKVLALVQFGAGWPSLEPSDLIAQAQTGNPDLTKRTDAWLLVHGEIFPGGDASFGIQNVPDDALPSPDILGGEDDRVIRALAGADLIRLIHEQGASWDTFAIDLT